MSIHVNDPDGAASLRRRALSKLTGHRGAQGARADASAALAVLHELASSAATAGDALALLHELQVHQVELDIQDEELRNSRIDLEASLVRQAQLYDFAPVGCFTVDAGTVLFELNLTGARLLGLDRDAAIGRTLDDFISPDSCRTLRSMLGRVTPDAGLQRCELELLAGRDTPCIVHATCAADPASDRFLVAFLDAGAFTASTPTGAKTSP